MQKNKQYFNIKEVSNILNLKEHVIRHWDSIDPKTKRLRIEGLSMRTKGGTRYFNQNHIISFIYVLLSKIYYKIAHRSHPINCLPFLSRTLHVMGTPVKKWNLVLSLLSPYSMQAQSVHKPAKSLFDDDEEACLDDRRACLPRLNIW